MAKNKKGEFEISTDKRNKDNIILHVMDDTSRKVMKITLHKGQFSLALLQQGSVECKYSNEE